MTAAVILATEVHGGNRELGRVSRVRRRGGTVGPMLRLMPVFVLAFAACSGDPQGPDRIPPDVKGSPSDLHTPPGTYAGYRVSYPCSMSWIAVGVQGIGANVVTDSNDIFRIGTEIFATLSDVPSVFSHGGEGLQCHAGIGTNIALDDWRDVDTLIARIGAYLHEHDLSLQVGIEVSGIPHAVHD